MDTTPEYILMCEKAVEIQECKPEVGDFYAWTNPTEEKWKPSWLSDKMTLGLLFGDSKYSETIGIYLPRQDQLQEILYYTLKFELLEHFRMWYIATDATGRYNSMEQLWLAFVMNEKYHKVWNGKDWVKDEKN